VDAELERLTNRLAGEGHQKTIGKLQQKLKELQKAMAETAKLQVTSSPKRREAYDTTLRDLEDEATVVERRLEEAQSAHSTMQRLRNELPSSVARCKDVAGQLLQLQDAERQVAVRELIDRVRVDFATHEATVVVKLLR
jgi:conjugal transfer/entry exclusion protein